MAAPHANHDAIVALLSGIDKGEKQQVVQAVDKIIGLLEESKLAYRQSINPSLVGCHMVNRNGYGLSPIEVHSAGLLAHHDLLDDFTTLSHFEIAFLTSSIFDSANR